jgi:rubrerythrin
MLQIDSKYIEKALSANALEELYPLLQKAIELEHSTIPPYLTAMFSLKPGTNLVQRQIIHSIVIEEMLHMSIAANILNALGESRRSTKAILYRNTRDHCRWALATG